MKKILAVLLCLVMVFSLAACGGGSDADAPKKVCFVARASADTFAAWLTSEMKKNAEMISERIRTVTSNLERCPVF